MARAAAQRGDYVAAVNIVIPLAEAGNADAQLFLATSYSLGLGQPQDDAWAYKWYRAAMKSGHPYAHEAMGLFFGKFVSKYERGNRQDIAEFRTAEQKMIAVIEVPARTGDHFAQFIFGLILADWLFGWQDGTSANCKDAIHGSCRPPAQVNPDSV